GQRLARERRHLEPPGELGPEDPGEAIRLGHAGGRGILARGWGLRRRVVDGDVHARQRRWRSLGGAAGDEGEGERGEAGAAHGFFCFLALVPPFLGAAALAGGAALGARARGCPSSWPASAAFSTAWPAGRVSTMVLRVGPRYWAATRWTSSLVTAR